MWLLRLCKGRRNRASRRSRWSQTSKLGLEDKSNLMCLARIDNNNGWPSIILDSSPTALTLADTLVAAQNTLVSLLVRPFSSNSATPPPPVTRVRFKITGEQAGG